MNVKELPNWRNPIMVAAFGGWGDAAGVATTAAGFLLQKREATTAAEFDPEELFVLSDTRPHVRLEEGGQRRIQWPSISLIAASGEPREVAVLLGPEPQLRWRTFARQVASFWRANGQGGPVVVLGAFLAGVSHAAPVMLTGFATTPELRARLTERGINPSGYEGPTGIHSALVEALEAEGVPCLSVWAAVPHYLAAFPNPKACAALLRAVDGVLELGLDLSELDEAARVFEQQVKAALARSGQMVTLAQAQPSGEAARPPERASESELPPPDELVKGVEEFLRRNRSS